MGNKIIFIVLLLLCGHLDRRFGIIFSLSLIFNRKRRFVLVVGCLFVEVLFVFVVFVLEVRFHFY